MMEKFQSFFWSLGRIASLCYSSTSSSPRIADSHKLDGQLLD